MAERRSVASPSRRTNEETFLCKTGAGWFRANNDTARGVLILPTGYGLKTTFGTQRWDAGFRQCRAMSSRHRQPTDGHPGILPGRMKRALCVSDVRGLLGRSRSALQPISCVCRISVRSIIAPATWDQKRRDRDGHDQTEGLTNRLFTSVAIGMAHIHWQISSRNSATARKNGKP
jgi:hypothetical protein